MGVYEGVVRWSRRAVMLALVPVAAMVMLPNGSSAVEEAVVIPPPAMDVQGATAKTATAVFAGGCVWGVQGVFQHTKGVTRAVSGYAGGKADDATYPAVSSGSTAHAEAVEVTYDPTQVTYGQLLQVYFSVAHNPTQLNYQGPDHGTQYRSAVFPVTDEERQVAAAYIVQLDAATAFPAPIVTKIEPFTGFYAAEQYHQDFLTNNPDYPYIVINDLPKIEALKTVFPALYRPDPVLVGQL
jgi:peptide-methionine (S)-S-oxide reductase